jgi:hypothetical protein
VSFGLASVRRRRQWKIFGFNFLVSIFSLAFELISCPKPVTNGTLSILEHLSHKLLQTSLSITVSKKSEVNSSWPISKGNSFANANS